MRRRLIQLAVFLLLGAIINVAVAWTCAASPFGVRQAEAPDHQPAIDLWERSSVPVPTLHSQSFPNPSAMPLTKSMASAGELRAWGLRVRYAGGTTVFVKASPPCGTCVYMVSSGWPAIAFQGERWDTQPFADLAETRPAIAVAELTHLGCVGFWRASAAHPLHDVIGEFLGERLVPLRPLWPGFTLNTLFSATILFALIRGPFMLRRAIRRQRGLCAACGYDLRGHGDGKTSSATVCPECGPS